MLEIRDLHASIGGKEILQGINLVIRDGEVHALMGQNGAGKSTLSNIIVGHPAYEVTQGTITYNRQDLLSMAPEERAHAGIFLSFQQPVEIPGVSMTNFMRAALNAKRKAQGLEPIPATEFLKLMRERRKIVELDNRLMNRSVNEGFSGGEKKRNEIFQMAMLEPTFAILDETDSGLDVDALRIVAEGFNKLRKPETSALVITHYQRLLDYLRPDIIHVLIKTVDRLLGRKEGEDLDLITYVTDRAGHDMRYAIDSRKLQRELGWEPSLQFEEGIEKTVRWYLDNQAWMDHITSGEYEKYYEDMYKNR